MYGDEEFFQIGPICYMRYITYEGFMFYVAFWLFQFVKTQIVKNAKFPIFLNVLWAQPEKLGWC